VIGSIYPEASPLPYRTRLKDSGFQRIGESTSRYPIAQMMGIARSSTGPARLNANRPGIVPSLPIRASAYARG
jgi:hypothetical protein